MTTQGPEASQPSKILIPAILGVTALLCLFEIAWFWHYCGRNITADAISYIGLARHLLDGHFIASLHGYWSPLVSWLIAAAALFTTDLTFAGHLVTTATLLALFPLVYWLSYRLWKSRLAAAISTLWFAVARGVVAMGVCSILADFLLTGMVCVYFILLLNSLRDGRSRNWLLLGAAHSAAFLAKAIAMPWLALTTLMAAVLTCGKSWRRFVLAVLPALLLPACVWLGYGSLLRLKYGYFTTGYQLRYHLIVDSHRHFHSADPYGFLETSRVYDRYLVTEMSQAELQTFRVPNPELLPIVLKNESRNLPEAVKQVIILLTPGGALCLLLALWWLFRNRHRFPAEFRFLGLIIFSSATLLLAYCMLVFDSRYVLPTIPVLIAAGSLPLAPAEKEFALLDRDPVLRKALVVLLAAGALFFQLYWASPFRTINRDFEIACYNGARELRRRQPEGKTLVTVGEGPFPAQGVGREAGIYTAYFAGRSVVGLNVALPDAAALPDLARKISACHADAVLIWGSAASGRYSLLRETLVRSFPVASEAPITDPQKGEVGTILFAQR
jgi:hypothetical protein